MPVRIILLRAVNVGGTTRLTMAELKRIGEDAGLANARTYIASGNLLGRTDADERALRADMEARLASHTGRAPAVSIRTADELTKVLAENPFADADPTRTVAIFLDAPPATDALSHATGVNGEKMALGHREIYVHYPEGISRSKLKLPAATLGTARNLNTIGALLKLARAME